MPRTATPALDLSALANSEEHTPAPSEVRVPDEVKAFVDAGHQAWKDAPKKWRRVVLGSEDAVKSVRNMARRYAKATGRTFRVKDQDDKNALVYKVTDKFQSQNSAASDG